MSTPKSQSLAMKTVHISGSTSATTALVQFEIDLPLIPLARLIGKDNAVRAWQRSRLSLSNLHDRIAELGIQCRAETPSSLFLAGNLMTGPDLRQEADERVAAGLRSRYLTASDLSREFGIHRDGAILSSGNLALDPRKLTAGLLTLAQSRGACLYRDVEVQHATATKTEVSVETTGGPTIRCSHLVLATGYEMLDLVPAVNHQIVSTWAMATARQPLAIWPKSAFLWEASDPYLYIRATHDGRIICGGEDEDFSDEARRDALIKPKIAAIRKKLGALLPKIDTEPAYAWAGSFGSTKTGLPYIGAIPYRPRVFAIMGYGGNGITYAQLASEIIASELAGKTDASADLFSFK